MTLIITSQIYFQVTIILSTLISLTYLYTSHFIHDLILFFVYLGDVKEYFSRYSVDKYEGNDNETFE